MQLQLVGNYCLGSCGVDHCHNKELLLLQIRYHGLAWEFSKISIGLLELLLLKWRIIASCRNTTNWLSLSKEAPLEYYYAWSSSVKITDHLDNYTFSFDSYLEVSLQFFPKQHADLKLLRFLIVMVM